MSLTTKLGLVPWLLGALLGGSGACTSSSPIPARDLQLQTTFKVAPGEERYECYRMNVNADAFITKLATSAAPGVHHQILAVTDQSQPEGVSTCSSVLQAETLSWLFVANSNPLDFAMPASVAYRIPAGRQLVLDMHLFNPSDSPIETTLTVNLTGIAETEVVSIAQLVEAGSLQINLPPDRATTISGTCTLAKDVSLFGLLPHMHSLGTSFKASFTRGSGDVMLYDGAFSGEMQQFQRFDPMAMPAGTPLNVECDYFNSSSATVVYGPSAHDEMCFGIAYYYPAIDGQGPLCLK